MKTKKISLNHASKSIFYILLLFLAIQFNSCSTIIDEVYNPFVGHNWVVMVDGNRDKCSLRFKTDFSTIRCDDNFGPYKVHSDVYIDFPWGYTIGNIYDYHANFSGTLNYNPTIQTIGGLTGEKFKSNYYIVGYVFTKEGSLLGTFTAYRIE